MSLTEQANKIKKHLENRSKQLNPNNILYWKARRKEERPKNWKVD